MNEIGSEFWIDAAFTHIEHNPVLERWTGSQRSYLSGRTALSAILDDICLSAQWKQQVLAYLPSYCCHTMIEPFIRHGMRVEFYTVKFENGEFKQEIDASKVCDVILVLDYFGYGREHRFVPKNATVIRDMTHAVFSHHAYVDDADYTFTSLRKWGAIAGAAIATKQNGEWLTEEATKQNSAYLSLRYTGYSDKARYFAGEAGTDKGYLQTFRQAESLLETDYQNYTADEESLRNAESLGDYVTQRRKNAEHLLFGLQNISIVEPLFPALNDGDAPLFVPIAVKNGKRDGLRQYLIENSIYCPVHWPLSSLHKITGKERELYDTELSLVCDQRYGVTEMERQLNMIRRFESENA